MRLTPDSRAPARAEPVVRAVSVVAVVIVVAVIVVVVVAAVGDVALGHPGSILPRGGG